jgi:hypothetical protein
LQGLLVAHELRERLRPKWLPRADTPSSNKILEAITHRSCADSIDFERYELLGDAFLKFATANHLFKARKEDADEGSLSLALHRRVSNGTLWRCAVVRFRLVALCAVCLTRAPTTHLEHPSPAASVPDFAICACNDSIPTDFVYASRPCACHTGCVQMTKWLGIADDALPDGWQWKLRGVADSIRLAPFRLIYWTPPGLLDVVKPTKKEVPGKVVSDAMEALIGVFYEALGPDRNNCWLACLGLLPDAPTVRASSLCLHDCLDTLFWDLAFSIVSHPGVQHL